jgi:hypothetical protein
MKSSLDKIRDIPDPEYVQIAPEPTGTIKRKLRTRSYKTELGKMSEEKQKWLYRFFAAFVLAIAELIVIILISIQS